jgi:DNA repair exonuclease SbcCD ATPase subunit
LLNRRIKELEDELEETNNSYKIEIAKIEATFKAQIADLEEKYEDLNVRYEKIEHFRGIELTLRSELETNKTNLEAEKKNRINDVNEKEREKIQATEKLRKDMLYKIKETKANLLALNDEQLQTTTRLTILQNHQLTTELEYQSKQTEQLLFKNNKMKTQIETLKRDIEIHKEVEKELAKRSHFCQKVIKRLKQQIKDLETEKQDLITGGRGGKMPGITNLKTLRASMGSPGKKRDSSLDESKQNDDLINYLE